MHRLPSTSGRFFTSPLSPIRPSFTSSQFPSHQLRRNITHLPQSVKLEDLKGVKNCFTALPRSIVRVEGIHAAKFLQGLMTNNIGLLDPGTPEHSTSLYSVMLNTQGRVLYDFFVTKPEENTYLLEFDSDLAVSAIQHMERFKLRSKVTLSDMSNEFQVWVAFGKNLEGLAAHGAFTDPRTPLMGMRTNFEHFTPVTPAEYHLYRIFHGVSEGKEDYPIGVALPFECNLEYLNGVSFNKGCYLGQELTARTHYTGVIRKRLFPFRVKGKEEEEKEKNDGVFPSWLLQSSLPHPVTENSLHTLDGKGKAKVFSSAHHLGMAKVRLEHLSDPLTSSLFHLRSQEKAEEFSVQLLRPFWWSQYLQQQEKAKAKLTRQFLEEERIKSEIAG